MTQFLKWVPIETVADKVQNFSNSVTQDITLKLGIFFLYLWYYIVFEAQKIQAITDFYAIIVLNVQCISIRGIKITVATTSEMEINALWNTLHTYCYGIHSKHDIPYSANGNNCGSYRGSPILVMSATWGFRGQLHTVVIKKSPVHQMTVQYTDLSRSFVIIS